MPGCVAAWCTNSSSKGFKMNYFPRNKVRQDAWVKNMNRANWLPTPHSALCEVHFAPEMWEKIRIDGKKKLKTCAVPTIFIVNDTQTLSNEKDEISTKKRSILDSITILRRKSRYCARKGDELRNRCNTELYRAKVVNNEQTTDNRDFEDFYESNIENVLKDGGLLEEQVDISQNEMMSGSASNGYVTKLTKTEKLLEKSEQMRKIMRMKHKRKIEELQSKIKQLETEVDEKGTLSESIKNILNEDQIKILTNKCSRVPQWCNSTLINSYKLKYACGRSGYNELLRQGFPLPSHRTLRRHLQIWKFQSEVRTDAKDR